MDRIITPKPIQQPGLITPRAPHFSEEERKRHQEERRHHEEEEKPEDSAHYDVSLPDEDNPIGTKIDIQI